MKTAGKVIFWIGTAPLIISVLMMSGRLFIDFNHSDIAGPLYLLGFSGLITSLPIAAFGLILWLFKINENIKQVVGCILCFLGPIGFLISYLLFDAGANSYEDIDQYGLPFLGLEVAVISFIFLVMGIILFFVGRSKAKKQ